VKALGLDKFSEASERKMLEETLAEQSQQPQKPSTKKFAGLIRIFTNETILAILLINLTLIVFFSTPIFTPNSVYIPGDNAIKLDNALFNMDLPTDKMNIGFVDPIKTFLPDLHYSRERLSQGSFPLWNDLNANGMPHFASLQSAVLSPFSLPVYIFGTKDGWLLSQYLKLLAIALFSYGFLRTLRVNSWVALISAIACTYSGYIIIWNPGPHIASVVALPAGLFFVEKAYQSTAERPRILYLLGLSGAVASAILGGHPESGFFALIVVSIYILFKIWGFPADKLIRAKQVITFGFFGLLGIGFACVQLLPFLEYFSIWRTGTNDHKVHFFVPDDWLITNIFPTIYGYAGQPYVAGPGGKTAELFLPYVGATFIFLAFCGIVVLYRDKLFWFFALVTLAGFGYVYNLFPFNIWLAKLPIFQDSVAQRSSFSLSFTLCCTAALVLNHFFEKGLKLKALLLFILAAFVFLGTALGAVVTNLEQLNIDTSTKGFQKYVPEQIWYVCILFAIAILAIILTTRGRWRSLGVALLLGVAFAQSGWLLKDVNGTVDSRYAYPVTSEIKKLQEIAGRQPVVFYNQIFLTPMTNLVYDLNDLRYFDAVYVPAYSKLLTQTFGANDVINHTIVKISSSGLKLFGAQYIVSQTKLDMDYSYAPKTVEGSYPLALLNTELAQTFVSSGDNLSGIDLYFGLYGRPNNCNVEMTLSEAATPNKPLRTVNFSCKSPTEQRYYQVYFDTIPQSKGKTYRLTLKSPDGVVRNQVALFASDIIPKGSQLYSNNQPTKGALLFREVNRIAGGPYQQVWADETNHVYYYKFTQALPHYYAVGQTLKPANEQELTNLTFNRTFDPATAAALSPESKIAALNGTEFTAPQIIEEKPEYKKLHFSRATPGFLATSMTNYPGWKIKINGVETPVVRTNYAFLGAPLPAGETDVEIYYDPLSFKLGLALTALSILLAIGLVIWVWSGRKNTLIRSI